MEKNTEKVFIIIILEGNIKGNGLTIKSMDMAWFSMPMVIDTKAHGKMESVLITEFINMLMEIFTMDNGEMI